MTHFDESWLVAHQAKMSGLRGIPTKPPPLLVEFSIPVATRLPNVAQGHHWKASMDYRKSLLALVAPAVKPWEGHAPMECARITIVRRSIGSPDPGAAMASVKPLVDLLLVRSKTHPHSFGLVRDDSAQHIKLIVSSERVRHRDQQGTDVRIERLS